MKKQTNIEKTKYIAIAGIFLALHVVISGFFIPVGENLRIYFTYLLVMTLAIILPPKMAFLYAFIEDIIAFFVMPPGGPFFFGYTITAIVSMMIYSFFLYKEVTLSRIVLAKTSVNIIANIFLNSIWSAMLYSHGFIYYLGKSIVKNTVLLPVEILGFVLFYQLVYPIFVKNKFLKPGEKALQIHTGCPIKKLFSK